MSTFRGRGWILWGSSYGRSQCIGCRRPIVQGDRCPDCQALVRTRASTRRRRKRRR